MYRPKSSLDRKKIPLQTKYPNMYHSWYPSVSNAALIVQRKSKKKKKKKKNGRKSIKDCMPASAGGKQKKHAGYSLIFWSLAGKDRKKKK